MNAISRLERLYTIIEGYGLEKYVTFDLGMLSQFEYYTGVIFRGYTYGTGDAVVKGGRYDTLLQKFGKEAPSVGLVVVVDELMIAMSRQKLEMEEADSVMMVLYDANRLMDALKKANALREKGNSVQMDCKKDSKCLHDYMEYAKRFDIETIYYFESNGDVKFWEVNP